MDDKSQLLEKLRERLADVEPLPGDDNFLSHETLMRYLKARDWNVKDAEKLLRSTIEWRRKVSPLTSDCVGCHQKPGMHCIRQIGHDEMGRPVIYSCFAQSAVRKNGLEETITHSTYLIENAKHTMPPGVMTWVLIIDCTGISLPACNPKLAYGSTQILSNHYPERLGLVVCLNHNALFQGVWKAIKVFLHPGTVSKMKLVRSKKKVRDLFDRIFSEELRDWLLDEIKLNKHIPSSQRQFWLPPGYHGAHDPRGSPSYVKDYIEPYLSKADSPKQHKPHPNIIDALMGKENALRPPTADPSPPPVAAASHNNGEGSDADEDFDEDIDIDDEFQIPTDAEPLQS